MHRSSSSSSPQGPGRAILRRLGGRGPNKGDLIYRELKTRILNETFSPGQSISANRIAKEFGVSRGIVCESLARLRAEGLVRNEGAYARTYVEQRDLPLVVEHYEVREVIEGAAARLAAQNMNAWQVAELRRLAEQAMQAEVNSEAAKQANLAFHHYLVSNCGNPLLMRIYEVHHLAPVSVTGPIQPGVRQPPLDRAFFDELCNAIAARDGAAAEACIRKDLRQITNELRSAVSASPIAPL